MININNEIKLNELEYNIFQILLNTIKYQNKNTILRAAGGWVRDKILGLPSDDIDIALDNQSGSEFANAINEYLQQNGLETHTVAVIHANPEQSKHLETARLRVLGLELDLVNLRTETYTANSRIPSISEEFGSPLEDALRRDFTINSLFYNLHTQQIEDLTGYGLQDIQDGLIRTPLDPSVTFTDDPLRMLRAVRFSSRFNYRLHESIREVAIQSETHDALHLKVSKERQLKEISGCFSGPLCRPILAISTLYELDLLSTVFSLPSYESLSGELQVDISQSMFPNLNDLLQGWQSLSFQCSCWINCFLQVLSSHSKLIDTSLEPLLLFHPSLHTSPMHNYESLNIPTSLLSSPLINNIEIFSSSHQLSSSELFWTSCVAGLRSVNLKEKKNRTITLPQVVLRDSLKLDNDTQKAVVLTLQASQSFQQLISQIPTNLNELSTESRSLLRETLGLILRDSKQYWRNGLLVAASLDLSTKTSHRNPFNQSLEANKISLEHLEIISLYRYIGSIILLFELDEIWLSRPYYDGDAIINLLQMKRGPQLGQLLEKQFRWQLKYPTQTKEECLEYLREELNLILNK